MDEAFNLNDAMLGSDGAFIEFLSVFFRLLSQSILKWNMVALKPWRLTE